MAHWALGMQHGVCGQPSFGDWGLVCGKFSLRDWIWLMMMVGIPGQGLGFQV